MDRKSFGAEYDYQSPAEVSSPEQSHAGPERVFGGLLLLAVVAVLGVIGYKLLLRPAPDTAGDERAFAQVDLRLTEVEKRLEKLETTRPAGPSTSGSNARKEKTDAAVAPPTQTAPHDNPKTVYRVIYQEPPLVVPPPDQRFTEIQKGLGVLQDEAKANREALQATSDQLANVAGQVGAEHGEILRSQEQLNQLLARTERTPYSFELRRGSLRQSVGPLSLSLKSMNLKKQRYTACVFIQESCFELKERSPFEVVQFSVSGDSLPYQVIVTKIQNDGVAGYLEVPRDKATR